MNAKIRVKKDGVTKRLDAKLRQFDKLSGFLNRNVYQYYRVFQAKRWDTENISEGNRWPRLKPSYAAMKKIRFASFPYGGERMGIATGKLIKGVIGPGRDHRKIVKKTGTVTSLIVSTAVPYAQYFDAKRPIAQVGEKTVKAIKGMIRNYIRQ